MKNIPAFTSWRTAPAPVPGSEIAEKYSADVIVVGFGNSGMPAVRAAAEAGASVIGIEKMTEKKFNVLGVDVGYINSDFLAGKGVPRVDPLELFNEWMRRAGNHANTKLVMQFCQKCGDAFDWYTGPCPPEQLKTVGVEYWPLGKKISLERFRDKSSGPVPSCLRGDSILKLPVVWFDDVLQYKNCLSVLSPESDKLQDSIWLMYN